MSSPTTTKEPEPTADQEPELMPATVPVSEPMTTTEPEPSASSILVTEPAIQSDQVCEPVSTSIPVGLLVVLDTEEWLIDWDSAEPVTTLVPTHEPLSPLVVLSGWMAVRS